MLVVLVGPDVFVTASQVVALLAKVSSTPFGLVPTTNWKYTFLSLPPGSDTFGKVNCVARFWLALPRR